VNEDRSNNQLVGAIAGGILGARFGPGGSVVGAVLGAFFGDQNTPRK
jgi:uncharacterized protein YcfJ